MELKKKAPQSSIKTVNLFKLTPSTLMALVTRYQSSMVLDL